MAINPGYFAGEALLSFRRNWVMSLVAVTIIYISLLLVGAFFLTSAVLGNVASSLEQKVSVQIFLKDGSAAADIQTLQANILGLRNAAGVNMVTGVTYVSKAEALERFKKRTADTPELWKQLRGNPLPASLEVALADPREVKGVVSAIIKDPTLAKVIKNPKDPEADDIKYGQGTVERLFAATGILRIVMAVFLSLLMLVSLVLIGNTIRLAIYARRREIGIMRLVGASNWFIRTPFLMEGVLQSLIGSILAILTLLAAQAIVVPWLKSNLQFIPVSVSGSVMGQLAALLIVSGVVIGALGSGAAVARYLKV
jgi:cell division transport system permease protein